MFEVLVREASARFNLGDKGLPLLQIVLQYMTGGGARGLAEFLERFKTAGLGPKVQSWLGGGPVAKSISNEELDGVLGGSEGLISTLTDKLELDREDVTAALGYLLPALVGKLTPGGSLPSRIPAEIQALAAEGKQRLEAPASRAPVATASGGAMRWLPWVIVALAVVLALGYCSTRNKAGDAAAPAVEEPASSPAVQEDADAVPAVTETAPTPGPATDEGDAAVPSAPEDASGPDAAAVQPEPAAAAPDATPDEDASDSGDNMDAGADDASAEEAGQGEAAASSIQAEIVDGKPVIKVFFDSGDATVPADFAKRAQGLSEYAAAHPDARLHVSGFTDTTGSAELNEELARNRAQAVQAALILMGIAEERIALEKPQQVSDTEGDQATARRVEVTVQ